MPPRNTPSTSTPVNRALRTGTPTGTRLRSLLAVLVVLTLAVAAGCSDGSPAQAPAPSGSAVSSAAASPSTGTSPADRVRVVGAPPGRHITVVDTGVPTWPRGPLPGQAAGRSPFTSGSPIYSLTPSGPLHATVSVDIALDRPVAAGLSVVAATREHPGDRWTYLPASLSADRTHARLSTNHLSDYGLLVVDPDALFTLFRKYFLDGVSSGLTAQVDKPSCDREDDARADGFHVSSTSTDSIYWCFGYDTKTGGGKRVLKVVNNRTYYLLLTHPNMAVLHNGHHLASYASLAKLTPNREISEPGTTVTFDADLDPGQSEGVATEFDGFSQNLYAAQTAAESLLAIVTLEGADGAEVPKAVDIIDKIVDIPKCYDALTDSPGAVLANCFDVAAVVAAFGTVGLLLAPLLAVGSFAQYLRSSYHALVDVVRDRDKYRIVISRTNPTIDILGPVTAAAAKATGGVVTGRGTFRTDFNGAPTTGHLTCSGPTRLPVGASTICVNDDFDNGFTVAVRVRDADDGPMAQAEVLVGGVTCDEMDPWERQAFIDHPDRTGGRRC